MKCNGFHDRSPLAAFAIAAAVAVLVGLQGQMAAAADTGKAKEKSAASDQQQNAGRDRANADQGEKSNDQADHRDQASSKERDQANSSKDQAEPKQAQSKQNSRSGKGEAAEGRRNDRSEPRREIRNYRPDNSAEEQTDRDRDRSSTRSRTADRERSSDRESFGISFSGDGLVVGRIAGDSLAARARLRSGDEIVSVNGHRVSSSDEFDRWVNDVDRGQPISIVVLRDGRRETLRVQAQDEGRVNYNADTEADRSAPGEVAYLGVLLDEGYDDGAMVQSVQPGSPAEDAGLRQGDIIRSINGERVRSPDQLAALVSRMEPGSKAEIEYTRRQSGVVNVELGAKPASGRSSEDEDRRFSRDPSSDQGSLNDRSQDTRIRGEADFRGPLRGEDLQRDEGANPRSSERGANGRLRDEDAGQPRMRRDNGGLLPRLRNR